MFHGSVEDPNWCLTWKTRAMLPVKIFNWLALLDRYWTAERLARHDLMHAPCACSMTRSPRACTTYSSSAPSQDSSVLSSFRGADAHLGHQSGTMCSRIGASPHAPPRHCLLAKGSHPCFLSVPGFYGSTGTTLCSTARLHLFSTFPHHCRSTPLGRRRQHWLDEHLT